MDACEFLGIRESCAACREGVGGWETGCQESIFEEPTDFQPFNPPSSLLLSPPVFEVEPGREGQADGHRSRARVRHRADVSAGRTRLPGELAPLQLAFPDVIMPRAFLPRTILMLPVCVLFLFRRSRYSYVAWRKKLVCFDPWQGKHVFVPTTASCPQRQGADHAFRVRQEGLRGS